ncbi:hypothetical protein C9J03_23010 [Photobacterium gaetbulicola]|uniref:YkuD domain-containing protein n=1 Tax=Photobacterium gaetbulicola Gung47 TaxID=658445 RepID=A0A0C5WIT0_9GAMM|nr:murein L,D-transpeptidase catalytic domain family protein [Photobacterium gaetbulicola]AJR06077.1 hypothetical protein H744_1c1052 [Photobacterium gaetbulicola Gung47]PSU02732.1 hypothetical protein C9J03_23010 [Photobacterium gaetbulicola]
MNYCDIARLLIIISILSGCTSSSPQHGISIKEHPYFKPLLVESAISRSNSLGETPSSFTIIDYTLPSEVERLFIVDVESGHISHQSLVAHAKQSGYRLPTRFSNINGSNQSSVGLFKTGETYFGINGYSLRIDGLEVGINDKARSRFIVVHGADYVSEAFLKHNGTLGRSEGCFAIPFDGFEDVINRIKESGYIYVHH